MLRTPLHCAASCNNTAIAQLLVEHGACVFTTALSDHQRPSEKCEPDEDNYESCLHFLQGQPLVITCIVITCSWLRQCCLTTLFQCHWVQCPGDSVPVSPGSVSRRQIQTLTLKFNASFFIVNDDVNRFAN